MIERRIAIKSLGALSLGVAAPLLSKAERLVEPYETKKKSIVTDIQVVGGGVQPEQLPPSRQAGQAHDQYLLKVEAS